jgi:hypothetical protein
VLKAIDSKSSVKTFGDTILKCEQLLRNASVGQPIGQNRYALRNRSIGGANDESKEYVRKLSVLKTDSFDSILILQFIEISNYRPNCLDREYSSVRIAGCFWSLNTGSFDGQSNS